MHFEVNDGAGPFSIIHGDREAPARARQAGLAFRHFGPGERRKTDVHILARVAGDDGDLFPGDKRLTTLDDNTTPSTRSNMGSPSRVALTNIAMSEGIVTFGTEV